MTLALTLGGGTVAPALAPPSVRSRLRFFPFEDDEEGDARVAVAARRAMRVEAYKKAEQERRVHPENAPKGTFRAMLLKQMCSLARRTFAEHS